MKTHSVYLYVEGDYRSAYFQHSPGTQSQKCNREYHPTETSAWRLAKLMERILDSKKFWCTLVSPRSLTIVLSPDEEAAP